MTDYKALCAELLDEIPHESPLTCMARAALAQPEPEGPTPQPVPVSERLPGPEDCDAEGLCWWWCSPAERWLRCGIPEPDPSSHVHTHWLPARALPVPPQ
jgi:hypothetical protein